MLKINCEKYCDIMYQTYAQNTSRNTRSELLLVLRCNYSFVKELGKGRKYEVSKT